jgi:formylglycine-generating enzyme required for sulfatase activity
MKRLVAVLALAAACAAAPAADYVKLPGGRFESVLPQGAVPTASTPVDIAPFAMRATPVTAAEFARFLTQQPQWQRGKAGSAMADARYLSKWAGPVLLGASVPANSPVTDVSWFAASAFCEAEGGRLPTWLEWEYAAAADATRTDARRDPAWQRQILAWYEQPTPDVLPAVGGAPNAYGVRDLHGAIWEWVDDFNALFIAGDSRTQGDPDKLKFCGAGAINIIDRDSYAVLMRIALLSSLNAADTTGTLGFRCVKPLQGPP